MTAESKDYSALLQRERINLRNFAEVELWTVLLDVYVADVVMAVAEVGDSSARVLEYLQNRNMLGTRSRTREPAPPLKDQGK